MRKIIYYKNYFIDFYVTLTKKQQEKVKYILEIVGNSPIIPAKNFSNIVNSEGIYEIRIEFESNIYRILCFFDKGNLVILANGFQKKSQKTPKNEIDRAEKIRKEYFSEIQKK